MDLKKDKDYKIGQIRFNFRHNHYGHIKAIVAMCGETVITSVFISSKPLDGTRENVPLDEPLTITDKEHSYFITRIRKFPAETYSDYYLEDILSESDLKKSDAIYEIYLERLKKVGTARSGKSANLNFIITKHSKK